MTDAKKQERDTRLETDSVTRWLESDKSIADYEPTQTIVIERALAPTPRSWWKKIIDTMK